MNSYGHIQHTRPLRLLEERDSPVREHVKHAVDLALTAVYEKTRGVDVDARSLRVVVSFDDAVGAYQASATIEEARHIPIEEP
jgi:hypothetical protein